MQSPMTLGSRNQTRMAQQCLPLIWAYRHPQLARAFLDSLGLCTDRGQASILCPRPLILYNLCLSLVDDDVFKGPVKKRRRSDRDQRFRAFPSVEQSALKECECYDLAVWLVLMWLYSFPNVWKCSKEGKAKLERRMKYFQMQKRRLRGKDL